ncbi:heterokaryon incompatibility protein [Colletotrichum chrysophilum]|uniref:Heterokaryon incompatibility protein n=1 Tax=Colletotrichum chrysophilum TaxID=1836956 RepID=A0AAD9E9N6_9PEZI|nr:heterokaryon incompatibility protein [Colletotrichum chrysophilum]
MSVTTPSTKQLLQPFMSQGRKWLEECTANHASCSKAARHSTVFCTDNSLLISDLEGEGLVATRLLSFPLSPSSEEEDIVRLSLSESLSPHTKYVALSHRWGLKETCCTLKANLGDMVEKGMCTSSLPPTFREAIYVARGMGFSYIWIDSLCIIQDDKDDWKAEARRMAIIYDNATCTIVAMDGLDSEAGLSIQNLELKSAGILDSRAWVCQERMISPRSLIFSEDSLSWECRECDASFAEPSLVARRAPGTNETPTHPKDIFAFFRDFRLPRPIPKEENAWEDVEDEEESEEDAEDDELEGANHEGDDIDVDSSEDAVEDDDHEGSNEEAEDSSDDETHGMEINTTHFADDGQNHQGSEFDDEAYDSDGYPAYRGGLPGHAANLSVFLEGKGPSKLYRVHPDGPNDDGTDPFGDYMVVATDLSRPRDVYYPFLKTWWQFLSNYSSLSLSYSSDKFLAINGITTVAQRWTHLRSSFGLFYHFFETEMLWYVDPKGPSGERQKPWLVPTWSWASTRNGSVVNDMYRRLPMRGSLMIKPEIKMGMGTAFDQPLPFAAWMARRYHTLEMKGDLRKGVVTATPGINGETKYTIALDKLGRFSDEEVHDFRPDCAEEFPVGQSVNVLYMVWYHYDADYWKLDKHIDVGLVFKQMKGETEITMYEEDVAKESTSEQRLLTRLGYLETTYPTGSRRNMAEVMEELTWYFVRVA